MAASLEARLAAEAERTGSQAIVSATETQPRVALVSVGLGRVQRGFERWAGDLFRVMPNQVDLTLFRSAGAQHERERVPPWLVPATRIARALPLGALAGTAEYNRDCLAFATCLLPDLMMGRFDVIHLVDPPMAIALQRLKRIFRFRARILFTDGCAMPPEYYAGIDHIHHVAPQSYDRGIQFGVPPSHMTLVPSGVYTERFQNARTRDELRARYSIAESTFVVLAVSALRRDHKRVHHIIEEAAQLSGDVLLWLDGNPEDTAIPGLAREKLGDRCRMTHVSSEELPNLYTLADVMVQASLWESFGLAIVEAMAAGTMVLAHKEDHFRWLIGDPALPDEYASPGALTARLRELREHPDPRCAGELNQCTSASTDASGPCLCQPLPKSSGAMTQPLTWRETRMRIRKDYAASLTW